MSAFFIYLLKVTVVLNLSWIPFLITRKSKYFTVNRFYLLAIMFISLLLPFVNWESQLPASTGMVYFMDAIEVNPESTTAIPGSDTDLFSVLFIFYITISSLFLLRFFVRIITLMKLIIKNKKVKQAGYSIVFINERNSFSFLRFLFLNDENTDVRIIEHEKVHARQLHSADIILTEFYIIMNWMNPMAYLLKKELQQIHEYIADDKVIQKYDSKDYHQLILSSVLNIPSPALSHSFTTLTLKNRIIMMKKKNRSKSILLTLAAALPLAVISSAALSGSTELSTFLQTPSFTTGENPNPAPESGNETSPQFLGGDEALAKFISENLKYPESAKKNNKAGKVYISFVVDKNGKVKNATVKRGFDTDCDNEALRVISMMPDWTPGTTNGKSADVEMVLPIKFGL